MRTYEAGPGEHISETVTKMVAMLGSSDESVMTEFNGIQIVAYPGVDADALASFYERESSRRHEEWKASPAGQQAAREAAERQSKADAARAEGIKPFNIKDAATWQRYVDWNQDDYGACCVRYAARWANLMEAQMSVGAVLEDIAEATGNEADAEGITGFMYGCAVHMLSEVWEHGERLRRWHNLRTQLHGEGAKANESGGVLNPALLSIG